jgi:hypothetical protein
MKAKQFTMIFILTFMSMSQSLLMAENTYQNRDDRIVREVAVDAVDGDCVSYVNMSFVGEVETSRVGRRDITAKMNGEVILDEAGYTHGSVTVDFSGREAGATVSFEGESVYIIANGQVMDIMPNDSLFVAIDGEVLYLPEITKSVMDEWADSSPSDWSTAALSLAAFTQVGMTAVFQRNMEVARVAKGPSLWCKGACILVGGLATAIAALGCGAITAGCAVATTITIGGTAVPCTWAIAACAGGTFVGGAAAYELWLELVWGD